MSLETATNDLRVRTLGPIGYDFGRLVYLSSLRDFSTGEYHHDGLAHCYSASTAAGALAVCHREVFYHLTLSPLSAFMEQLERFVRSSAHDVEKVMRSWETLEAYRVVIPGDCDPLTAALFRSNVKIAIALLKDRHSSRPATPRPALPHLSLGR